MKPNKRFATVAAAALAATGLGVVMAPSALAAETDTSTQQLYCWVNGISSTPASWPASGTVTKTLTATEEVLPNFDQAEDVDLSFSFTAGPGNGPFAVSQTTTVTYTITDANGTRDVTGSPGTAYAVPANTPGPADTVTDSIELETAGATTITVKSIRFDGTVTTPGPFLGSTSFTTCNAGAANPETTPVATDLSVSFNVVAAPPQISAPSSGAPGTSIQVTGEFFEAGDTYTVTFLDSSNNPVGTAATGTVSPQGNILANLTVVGAATQISVADQTNPAVVQGFTAIADSCQADPDLDGGAPGCALTQNLVFSVGTGTLSQEIPAATVCAPIAQATCNAQNSAALQVDFGSVATGAAAKTVGAVLNEVQVTDARGTNTGWSLTAQMPTAFTAAGGKSIRQTQMRLTPACDLIDNVDPDGPFGTTTDSSAVIQCGPASQVMGTVGAFGVVSPTTVTLATRATSDALGAFNSGGGFYGIDGQFELTLPAFQATGSYTSSVVITLA